MLHKELWTPFLNDYEKHNLPFPFDWKMRPNEMTKMVGDVESGEVQCPYGDYSKWSIGCLLLSRKRHNILSVSEPNKSELDPENEEGNDWEERHCSIFTRTKSVPLKERWIDLNAIDESIIKRQ
jgi:hypothetical protein